MSILGCVCGNSITYILSGILNQKASFIGCKELQYQFLGFSLWLFH